MDKCPHCGKSLEQAPLELVLAAEAGFKEVASLPLVSGREYPIYDKMVAVWHDAYPSVEMNVEFAKIRAWLLSNPTKRKTERGMARFINNWLSRAQDRGGNYGGNGTNTFEAEREQIRRVVREGR